MAEAVAVLVMAYGGPDKIDDVEPYLQDIRGGRPTKPQLVEEIRARYARIGGRSPILELTRAQATAIGRELGTGFRVYVGMRHWHPYIRDTVAEIKRAGHRRLVGVVMAPHDSSMSIGAYEKKLLEATGSDIETTLVRSWWANPHFLDTVAAHVTQALRRFPRPEDVQVIFTAHSLPRSILASGDPYPDELQRTAQVLAARLRLRPDQWSVAWQSAGRRPEPWLEPDAAAVLEQLAAQGHRDVILAPIGFVCDHVEILYDVDVEYQALARRLGLRLERPHSLNDDPLLIATLDELARRAARERGWLA